jgi:Flp pilus assembly protein CpaB
MKKIRRNMGGKPKRKLPLLLGVSCVLLAVLGVTFVIEQNNQTQEFLVASNDLPAGSLLSETEFTAQAVNLGASADKYLTVDQAPKSTYLLGPVRAGQLIPRSMLSSTVIDERVPVVIDSKMGLPTGLVAGSSVDVWVAPAKQEDSIVEPFAIVVGAEVARLITNADMFAKPNPSVELWVPIDAVSPILSSIAAEASISLILRPTLAEVYE